MHSSVPLPSFCDAATPRVLAHRGLHTVAAENSRSSFTAAVQTGTPIIETDVHGSADGVAIICHDDDLTRVAGVSSRIRDMTAAQLMDINISHDDTLWTLEQALREFPGTRFNIDVKDDAAISGTINAVTAANAETRVLITSFSRARRLRTLAGLHNVATSTSATEFLWAWLAVLIGITPRLDGISAVQIPERYGLLRIVTPRIIRRFHKAGVEVHVWTVNDQQTMEKLLQMGVDGLVTDRCDLAMSVATSYRSHR